MHQLSVSNQYAVSDAQNWMNHICGSHELIVKKSQHLNFQHEYVRLANDSVSLGYIQYGTDVSIVNEKKLHCYSLSLPVSGEQELMTSGKNVVSNQNMALVVNPQEELQLNIAGDCRKLHLAIPKEKVKHTLQLLTGQQIDQEIIFDSRMQIESIEIAQWWQQVDFFIRDIHQMGISNFQYFHQEMESLLIKKLLFIQKHNYSELLNTHLGQQLPKELQQAVQFIQHNSKLPISLQDICDFSCSSATKINTLFKRYFQLSPMQYLKHTRLKNVYQTIQLSAPCNIADIALEHGFNHLGHFAKDYKLLFRESPRDTLKKQLETA